MTETSGFTCPLWNCYDAEPHTHPVCPDCGCMEYGNFLCNTCLAYMEQDPGLKYIYNQLAYLRSTAQAAARRAIQLEQNDVQKPDGTY